MGGGGGSGGRDEKKIVTGIFKSLYLYKQFFLISILQQTRAFVSANHFFWPFSFCKLYSRFKIFRPHPSRKIMVCPWCSFYLACCLHQSFKDGVTSKI